MGVSNKEKLFCRCDVRFTVVTAAAATTPATSSVSFSHHSTVL